tara:strand:- start:489 stop:629 length:141 start_codon:yes stop_codon:yes gene_type:complete
MKFLNFNGAIIMDFTEGGTEIEISIVCCANLEQDAGELSRVVELLE